MRFGLGKKNDTYSEYDEEYSEDYGEEYEEEEYYDEEDYIEDSDEYSEPEDGEFFDEDSEEYEEDEYLDEEYADEEEAYEETAEYDEGEYYEDSSTYDVASQFVSGAVEAENKDLFYDGEIEYIDEEPTYTEGMTAEVQAQYVDGATSDEDEYDYTYEKPEEEKGLHLGKMDILLMIASAAVIVCVIFVGYVLLNSRNTTEEVSVENTVGYQVGTQIAGLEIAGQSGLDALHDEYLGRKEPEEIIEEPKEPESYEENEYTKTVAVEMKLTSVQKDLKIKLVNRETGKLVSNVPFIVTVTKADNTTEEWTDNDYDGVIYKKGLDGGDYKIKLQPLDTEKYRGYILPASEQKAQVKEKISYEKVDVKDEIKTESEINVSKEDTAVNETVEESVKTDTVEWVASTVSSQTYMEILKADIPDPAILATTQTASRTENEAALETENNPDQTPSGEGTEVPADTVVEPAIPTDLSLKPEQTDYVAVVGTPIMVKLILKGNLVEAPTISSYDASDATALQVVIQGMDMVITPLHANTSVVTVFAAYQENGEGVDTCFNITIKPDLRNDKTTKLLTKDKKPIYVFEEEKYREAVVADYYTAEHFYTSSGARYTGWQTIDKKVYFFTAKGEKVTGEQVIQGASFVFDDDGALISGSGTMGIDVSKWNGKVDWNAVKNSGISYVIIRCGYRGSSQGVLVEDPKFTENIKGAAAAGLKIGVYFFSQAIDEVEAVYEASFVLEKIKGYKLDYPVFLDVEPSKGRGDKIDSATRTAVCKAFCETIKAAGYTPGIYANKTWLNEKMDASALSGYKIWLAQYAATPTYSGKYDMWQYKKTGKVDGITGDVDLNISYLGY